MQKELNDKTDYGDLGGCMHLVAKPYWEGIPVYDFLEKKLYI